MDCRLLGKDHHIAWEAGLAIYGGIVIAIVVTRQNADGDDQSAEVMSDKVEGLLVWTIAVEQVASDQEQVKTLSICQLHNTLEGFAKLSSVLSSPSTSSATAL